MQIKTLILSNNKTLRKDIKDLQICVQRLKFSKICIILLVVKSSAIIGRCRIPKGSFI